MDLCTACGKTLLCKLEHQIIRNLDADAANRFGQPMQDDKGPMTMDLIQQPPSGVWGLRGVGRHEGRIGEID